MVVYLVMQFNEGLLKTCKNENLHNRIYGQRLQ